MELNNYFKYLNILEDLESRPLLEMAMERSRLKAKIINISKKLEEHMLKCIVYENATNDLKHWITEISSYIGDIANDTIKPNNKKLTKEQYCSYLFGYDYDDLSNMSTLLNSFKLDMEKQKYPNFNIDNNLKEKCFSIGNSFMLEVSDMLIKKEKYSNRDFGDLFLNILIKNGVKI